MARGSEVLPTGRLRVLEHALVVWQRGGDRGDYVPVLDDSPAVDAEWVVVGGGCSELGRLSQRTRPALLIRRSRSPRRS